MMLDHRFTPGRGHSQRLPGVRTRCWSSHVRTFTQSAARENRQQKKGSKRTSVHHNAAANCIGERTWSHFHTTCRGVEAIAIQK